MREISVHWHPSSTYGCGQKETLRKRDNKRLVSPSRQCSSTHFALGQGFLNREQCDSTGATDLAPAAFYTIYRLKSTLQGRCFCNATDIIKNATEELKKILQNALQ